MQLIEGSARNLPVRLFVQITKRNRVRQQLVYLFCHLQPYWLLEVERQSMVHGSVSLNLACALVETWLGADVASCSCMLLHLDSPLFRVAVYRFTKSRHFAQAEMCSSCFDTGSCVNRRLGNSVARWPKRMTECLARFAMRVSRGPGSGSAVKLKCISPIPISTTPDATI